jgi:two-component system, NtrC family, response regulator AtoC
VPVPAAGPDASGLESAAATRNAPELQGKERSIVEKTLERTGWNVTKSARLLGLSRDMMRYRIEKLGLSRPADESGSFPS